LTLCKKNILPGIGTFKPKFQSIYACCYIYIRKLSLMFFSTIAIIMIEVNMQKINKNDFVKLEDSMMFVSTIYESFEALEEVMGKLKLERPLFLIYLAKMSFADEVYKVAKENPHKTNLAEVPPSYIEIQNPHFGRWQ